MRLKRRFSWARGAGATGLVVAVVLGIAWTSSTDAAGLLAKKRVFRNLAFDSEGNFLKYLAIDTKTGEIKLAPVVSETESGAYWEVERAWDNYRGYRTYTIRSRSNSPYNGFYLTLDGESGQLRLKKRKAKLDYTTYWTIRYKSHMHGRGAYMIQNLGHSEGGFDMAFIGADEKTGEVKLTRNVSDGVLWTMNATQVPPSQYFAGDR